MQHERHALGRRQRLEHYEQREPHGVGEQRLLLGMATVFLAHGRLENVRTQRLLGARLARAQHVETHACHHCGQPPAEVCHVTRVGAAEPDPSFLDGIIRLAPRAEHAVSRRTQVRAVRLELFGQPVGTVHRRHSAPRMRVCDRSAHDASASAASDAVTITCQVASWDTACDTAAPDILKKMPA